jgi:hypothetical protein
MIAFPDLNLLLISSWIAFWFVKVVPKIFKLFHPLEGAIIHPHTVNSSCIPISRHGHVIQRRQSKILRTVFNAPRYTGNKTLHEDSGIPFVEDEINRLTNSYLHKLPGHPNEQVSHMHVPPASRRRLYRRWPTDVIDWTVRLHNKCYLRSEICHWIASPLKVYMLKQFTYSFLEADCKYPK